jgi:hypothetical protein
MTQKNTTDNWSEEIGKSAFEEISNLVAAVHLDWDRLEELRDASEDGEELEELEELEEMEESAGDCEDEDDARQRIQDDPLSLRIFGEKIDGNWEANKFELLLTTGGPAVRIVGELNQYGEPESARLEVQDWGKCWTEFFCDKKILLAYCNEFYFGD